MRVVQKGSKPHQARRTIAEHFWGGNTLSIFKKLEKFNPDFCFRFSAGGAHRGVWWI